ncbi:MAG: glycosyl transferase family 1, partial [Promethearchaeota archaeon]
MRIGMVHFRVGDLDGVSLEMDKWRVVLERMGHKVSYLAGSVGQTDGYAVPELSLNFEPALLIQKNAFTEFTDFKTEDEFESHITALTKQIQQKIQHYIDKFEIEFLIPNNMFGLPMNISASLALFEVIKENKLSGIALNHDFYWERKVYNPTVPLIQQYLDEFFPPKLSGIKHVVINSLAQKALEQKKGIQSSVVPNVFYFDEKPWEKDDFNCDLRERLNIDPSDIFVLHATRIIRRKGIELVIDLLEELSKKENLRKLQEKPLFDGRKFSQHNKYV